MNQPHDEYAEAELQRRLAEHDEITEQGIDVVRREGLIVVKGEVECGERRDAILRLVREAFPGKEVRSEIALIPVGRPLEVEEVS